MRARLSIPLEESWIFQADTENEGVKQKWHEEGPPLGENIKIPHTWNVQNGLQEFRGTGWYSCVFFAPAEWEGKLLRLQFDAVYRDAVVWVNGQKVGEHINSGYTSFVLEISSTVVFGENNRVVVSANNENSQTALPMGNSFDWADDGGIIRGVSLIVSGRAAIDYTKIQAVPVFSDEGEGCCSPYGLISGEICLWGQYGEANNTSLKMIVRVTSKDGTIISEEWEKSSFKSLLHFKNIKVESPKLWHFDHPHLYKVNLSLNVGEVLSDEVTVEIGFREIRSKGSTLLLNREPVRLMGVEWMPGSHPNRGMAETSSQLQEMLRHIKEANCVITRFHWQQDSKLLEWCDRNGLLVQEEIPHWQAPLDPDAEWLQTSMQHAQEMIQQHYNHPCIYAWGIGNEVNGQSPVTVRYFEKLKALVSDLDDTRFINYVSNTVHENSAKDATGVGDVIMWNDYIGTWHGDLDRPAVIDTITETYEDKPVIVAEYGLCEPAYEGGDKRRIQILTDNTSEYRNHSGIAAIIFFSLNDYRTQMGEAGEGMLRQRVHGSMYLDGTPKPSYEVLRQLASPINISLTLQYDLGKMEVIIETSNDIPSYRISGYTLRMIDTDGDVYAQEIPKLEPGERCVLQFLDIPQLRWDEMLLNIARPTGFTVLSGSLTRF
ncbi:glycoside hydrolase family 2 TIM barrel-domain containing protein [Paenibacillus pabuli]|uniref:glycoside hydrolase family 2 protein n=1 Tax=Paenibacillus pabuli TaxID=1472 RepID=UPI00324286C6